jgi:hypothetical protein
MGMTAVAAQAVEEKFGHTEAAAWLIEGKPLAEGTKRSVTTKFSKSTEFSLTKGGFTLKWTCSASVEGGSIENLKSASTPSERASGTISKFRWVGCKVVPGMGDCTVPSTISLPPLEFHVMAVGKSSRYIYFKPITGTKLFNLFIGASAYCPLGGTEREVTGSFAAETEADGVELLKQPLVWSHAAEELTGHQMTTNGTIQIIKGEELLRLL